MIKISLISLFLAALPLNAKEDPVHLNEVAKAVIANDPHKNLNDNGSILVIYRKNYKWEDFQYYKWNPKMLLLEKITKKEYDKLANQDKATSFHIMPPHKQVYNVSILTDSYVYIHQTKQFKKGVYP